MAGLKVIVPPAAEPVTLDDVKPQLRIDMDDDSYDSALAPLIIAAREWCEGYQNRAYITQTLELAIDRWPCGAIVLPRPPLQHVTSIKYTGRDGVETTWDETNYVPDDYSEPAKILRAYGVCWPSETLAPVNAIKVRYVAGYGDDAEDVPQAIRQAIILLVMHWFDNGMCDPPAAVTALLDLDRVVPI